MLDESFTFLFVVCLFESPQIELQKLQKVKVTKIREGKLLYGQRQNSRFMKSFVEDRERASRKCEYSFSGCQTDTNRRGR